MQTKALAMILGAAMTVGGLICTNSAFANGRFPTAKNLVVAGAGPTTQLVLGTTFGLLTSRDDGLHWNWACEPAIFVPDNFDPSIVLAGASRVLIGLPDGAAGAASPWCSFTRVSDLAGSPCTDLASDATGATIIAGLSGLTVPGEIAVSTDGTRFQRVYSQPGLTVVTVEVAPGLPSRLYATGYVQNQGTVFLRSDDTGAHFALVSNNLPVNATVYLAAVDRTNADVLYVRINQSTGGTSLLRSVDGGAHFDEVLRSTARMTGMTAGDDGRSLWAGSTDGAWGIQHSIDRGDHWSTVSTGLTTLCLRYNASKLYLCTEPSVDGDALKVSVDNGAHWSSLLDFHSITSANSCDGSTSVGAMCPVLWAGVQRTLGTVPDASVVTDTGSDVGGESGQGSEPAPHTPTCGCSVPGETRVRWGILSLGWVIAWMRLQRLRSQNPARAIQRKRAVS